MKRFPACIAIFAAIIVGGYALWSMMFQTIHVRFRITIDVEVGDETKSGTGVIDVAFQIYPDALASLGGGPNANPAVTGYAVTVDLGDKGLLLLTFQDAERWPNQMRARIRCPTDDIGCLPFAAYWRDGQYIAVDGSHRKAALGLLLQQKGPREIPFADLPRMVRVATINNPYSFYETVSPYNLEGRFGSGVKLSRVVLELTDSAVTPIPKIWPQTLWPGGTQSSYLGVP
jgi:hypothetical protein